MPNQNPSPEKTAAERMEEAIKGVDFTAVNFSMDTLYDARFPSEVTRHEFRQFCQRKAKELAAEREAQKRAEELAAKKTAPKE